jgi:phenylpyruvate tautomerase PptA (4-oxalocrotonate tautomerase family)
MPLIQMDLRQELTDDQLARLGAEVVDVVHAAIGSARAHINVIIRHGAGTHMIEAGGVREVKP